LINKKRKFTYQLEKPVQALPEYKILHKKKWEIILADPPWRYNDLKTGGSHKSGSGQHYLTMSKNEICALGCHLKLADNSYLFLWTTHPMIPDALEVMKEWGYEYRTVAFTWIKKTVNGKDLFGMGRWTRGNPEIILLGIRGKPKPISKGVANLTYAEKRRHSEKPEIIYEKIEQLCGKLPRLEMFARKKKNGWSAWGFELGMTK